MISCLVLTCFVEKLNCSDVIFLGVGRGRKPPLPHSIMFWSVCLLRYIHSGLVSKFVMIIKYEINAHFWSLYKFEYDSSKIIFVYYQVDKFPKVDTENDIYDRLRIKRSNLVTGKESPKISSTRATESISSGNWIKKIVEFIFVCLNLVNLSKI